MVTTEGEKDIMANLQRKARAADRMFTEIVRLMNDQLRIDRSTPFHQKEEMPSWL
jgi:hypothetical protein